MDAEMGEFLAAFGIGICIVVLGAYMAVTGDARMLHGYHRAAVPAAQMPALARATGIGLAASGVGCMMLAPFPGLADALGTGFTDVLSIVGAALLVLGIGFALGAVIKFNGSLFSFGPAGVSAGASPRWATIGFAILVCAVAVCATVVPGIMMAVSGDPSALHGYHLVNVAARDLPALARWEGGSMAVMGAGLVAGILGGMFGALRRPSPAWTKALAATGIAVFGAGLVAMLAVIVYFNGSLMG